MGQEKRGRLSLIEVLFGMLRRLTYISRFLDVAQYVVSSAIRLTATCRMIQARISLTSFGGLATSVGVRPPHVICTDQFCVK